MTRTARRVVDCRLGCQFRCRLNSTVRRVAQDHPGGQAGCRLLAHYLAQPRSPQLQLPWERLMLHVKLPLGVNGSRHRLPAMKQQSGLGDTAPCKPGGELGSRSVVLHHKLLLAWGFKSIALIVCDRLRVSSWFTRYVPE
ncbi:hypothetical protein WJX72_010485 [[Myrmecia] bisecta]|uniref:Uncharacterized protein n=1 Tax=[Myrmecia] bisecta TaxID=41462 RepID=A0AAW1PAL7_9CHLO